METWVIANQKGGVGKTTTVVSMAATLSQRGQRVLMVDLDPHGSLSSYFGFDSDLEVDSIYKLFQDDDICIESMINDTRFENIRLIPSSPALVTLDRQLGSQLGKGTVLRHGLAKVTDSFDYVLIDCSPTLGILMINALASGDILLMPVQTEFLALKGLERMLVTLSMVNKARGRPMPFVIVPTMYDRRTNASKDALNYLKEHHGKNLWDLVIPVDTQFREASKIGIPLLYFQPSSRGALAYASLVDTLINMVSGAKGYAKKEVKAYE